MKAEHRKELQTNLLADRMGRMVQRVKTGPSRRSVLWIVLAVLVLAVYIGLTWYWSEKRRAESDLWTRFGDTQLTSQGGLSPWVREDTRPALAARFEIAWMQLWESGLKRMASDAPTALKSIIYAEKAFTGLRDECKDDPVLGPEAAYALAVIDEARAVGDRSYLDKAIAKYKSVQSNYRESAAGKAAGQRAEYLEKNRLQVEEFYAFAGQRLPFGMYMQLQQMQMENPRRFDKTPAKDVPAPSPSD